MIWKTLDYSTNITGMVLYGMPYPEISFVPFHPNPHHFHPSLRAADTTRTPHGRGR